jgi:hypothetical protein
MARTVGCGIAETIWGTNVENLAAGLARLRTLFMLRHAVKNFIPFGLRANKDMCGDFGV